MQLTIQSSPLPGDKDWVDCGTYWLNINRQDGGGREEDAWKSARRKGWGHTEALLTGSNFGTAAEHNPFKTKQDLAFEMVTGLSQKPSEEAQAHMKRGKDNEPYVRQWYEKIRNVTVKEVGLAIPKFDIRIGASLDGMVGEDGCIEIKCPKAMYKKLLDPNLKNKHPSERISLTHYDQMVGGMAITDKKWCDYVVCDIATGQLYIERVPFDQMYWNQTLYPALKSFIDVDIKYVKDHMSK